MIEDYRGILVEGPRKAFTFVRIYGPRSEPSLEEEAKEFIKAMMANLVKGPEYRANAAEIECKYTIGLLGVEVPHTLNLTKHTLGQYKVICMTNVNDEDRHLVEAGFRLIRDTLTLNAAYRPNKPAQ